MAKKYIVKAKIEKPNNEIWYKTSNNQPVEIYDGLDWGTNEILNNEYDPIDDCCKIIFKEDVTEIPDGTQFDDGGASHLGFLNLVFEYESDSKYFPDLLKYNPSRVIEIIYFPKTIKKIGWFSFGGTSISNIDFFPEEIEEIGEYVLSQFNHYKDKHFEKVKLTNFTKLKKIGNNFLAYNFTENSEYIIENLLELEEIGDIIIVGCKKFIIRNLPKLQMQLEAWPGYVYGSSIVVGSNDYVEIDLIGVTSLKRTLIENCMYNRNETIQNLSINLPNLISVGETDENAGAWTVIYLINSNVNNLVKLNIPSLTAYNKHNGLFIINKLKKFDFSCFQNYFNNLNSTPDIILPDLESVDLRPLSNLTNIGDNFLRGYSGKQIDFTPLSKVTSIGNGFLREYSGKQIDFAPLSKVTSIGMEFLSSHHENNHNDNFIIDLSGLYNVKNIGDYAFGPMADENIVYPNGIFIINSEKALINILLKMTEGKYGYYSTPNFIYVNDSLIEEYKEAVPKIADKFKPLSEYNEEI